MLEDVQAAEAVFAFFDDTYVVTVPERVSALYAALREAPWWRARVVLNQAKMRVRNAAGRSRRGWPTCGRATRARVGAWTLPREAQGLIVLGTLLSTEPFLQRHLRETRAQHDELRQPQRPKRTSDPGSGLAYGAKAAASRAGAPSTGLPPRWHRNTEPPRAQLRHR